VPWWFGLRLLGGSHSSTLIGGIARTAASQVGQDMSCKRFAANVKFNQKMYTSATMTPKKYSIHAPVTIGLKTNMTATNNRRPNNVCVVESPMYRTRSTLPSAESNRTLNSSADSGGSETRAAGGS
jgi:hypothetical protein